MNAKFKPNSSTLTVHKPSCGYCDNFRVATKSLGPTNVAVLTFLEYKHPYTYFINIYILYIHIFYSILERTIWSLVLVVCQQWLGFYQV